MHSKKFIKPELEPKLKKHEQIANLIANPN